MFEQFQWRGELIPDIEKWAKERGEQMVHYRLTRHTPYGREISFGSMPETFWNTLMFKANEHYERLA
jgi:hypothetical protein